jgi:hypothetical protein
MSTSCSLSTYDLGWSDIGYCLLGGLSCVPYTVRHWEASEGEGCSSIYHKIIAVIEAFPLIGSLSALVERVVVFFFDCLCDLSKLISQYSGNTSAAEFVACVNQYGPTKLSPLRVEHAEEFERRGGVLNLAAIGKQVVCSRQDQFIVGCTSGKNRSQIAAVILKSSECKVLGVVAGGDSAMNLEAQAPMLVNPNIDLSSARNFYQVFGRSKVEQIGYAETSVWKRAHARGFYQNFINNLAGRTHFVVFGASGKSILRRLLQRAGRFDGFTLSYCPWMDEVKYPPQGSRMSSCSVEAYRTFAAKLRQVLVFL